MVSASTFSLPNISSTVLLFLSSGFNNNSSISLSSWFILPTRIFLSLLARVLSSVSPAPVAPKSLIAANSSLFLACFSNKASISLLVIWAALANLQESAIPASLNKLATLASIASRLSVERFLLPLGSLLSLSSIAFHSSISSLRFLSLAISSVLLISFAIELYMFLPTEGDWIAIVENNTFILNSASIPAIKDLFWSKTATSVRLCPTCVTNSSTYSIPELKLNAPKPFIAFLIDGLEAAFNIVFNLLTYPIVPNLSA